MQINVDIFYFLFILLILYTSFPFKYIHTHHNTMKNTKALIGSNIRRRRQELQITQGDLAKKIGLSRPSVVQYEGGHVNIPADTLHHIAVALKCKTSDLVNSPEDHAQIEKKYLAQMKKYQVSESATDYVTINSKLDTIINKLDQLLDG